MAKKLVAVTAIKHNGETFEAGATLDPSQFSRDELKELHDNGAVAVQDDSKPEDVKGPDLTPEELGQQGAQTQDVSAQAKESTAAQQNAKPEEKSATTEKAAPAKK